MSKRRRFKQPQSLKDRWLAAFAKQMREKVSLLPPGTEQEDMLRKASQADTAGSFGRMGKFAVVAVTEVKQGPPAILLTQKHAFKR
jgi:hypothetical protein